MSSDSSHSLPLFCVAVIAGAHGVRGHVKIKCFLDDPTLLKTSPSFLNEKGEEVYKIEKILSQKKDVFIVSLEGVTDRNQAESLKGSQLMFPRNQLPEVPEDTFYHAELIGLSVKSPQGQSLGKVHALYNFGAGDLLEVKTLKGKLEMIPFTEAMVPDINLKAGVLHLSGDGELFLKGGLDVT